MYLNVPILSKFEWHPFTISSAPEDEYISIHVRRNGDWTNALHAYLFDLDARCETPLNGAVEYPSILLDGPVGAPSQEYNRHRVVVLIGAGIGVTPFASILKSILYTWDDHRCTTCHTVCLPRDFQITKLYFYWVTKDHEALSWFAETMNQLHAMDSEGRLEIHTFYTKLSRKSLIEPLRLMQTFVHTEGGGDIISGLSTRNLTHFGRPEWKPILNKIASHHRNEDIGVFLCGPPKLDKEVAEVCHEFNTRGEFDVEFSYHSENF